MIERRVLKEPEPKADWAACVPLILKTMVKFKQRMLAKGLRRAWTWCPREGCGGKITATLNGPKNHMHAACDTEGCPINWME